MMLLQNEALLAGVDLSCLRCIGSAPRRCRLR